MQRSVPYHAVLGALMVLVLSGISLFVGVSDLSVRDVLAGGDEAMIFMVSRIPRTLAIILTGSSLAIAGLLFQMLARNRFVEPSTAGTVESAGLGLLVTILFFPASSVFVKMLIASGFAIAGTLLFLRILKSVPRSSPLLVPLVGLMLGGIIGSVATFFAYRFDLLQLLGTWTNGEFSGVLKSRYELLWLTAVLAGVAYLAADRFTILGLGEDVSVTLGLNFAQVRNLGLVIVSVISAVIVVTVGAIPFLGLVVPNIASRMVGDNLRASVPWAAALGASILLVCDMIGRVIRYPYEVPIGTVFGVVGSALFLYLLLGKRSHAA
ncbi:ABC transporter permease [Qingshengfaniella alkalisoli]|uniref:Iron chelate uptake ABC transporter family permease subunit n=1 Tax=Qingshengfaniella alkalisoli TaxID=2599296 RepID=A0A5B8JBS0_9RHOB|nr:iron chelate uptake ABC transporter family permease subunit [Qingshengfaniella alkalisoli]QDY71677.1 iron chelate uptake ABC transporter family permease subunit [Qingshengfaniella alkalisoli]